MTEHFINLRDENERLAAEGARMRRLLLGYRGWFERASQIAVNSIDEIQQIDAAIGPLTARHAERQKAMREVAEAASAARAHFLSAGTVEIADPFAFSSEVQRLTEQLDKALAKWREVESGTAASE